MAVASDYITGTITLTNGSVDFTGTGTAWRTAGFREGDTILVDNLTGVIAGTSLLDPLILSNNTGKLTRAWTGTTGTRPYRMRYMADGARVSAETRNLIELLGNGNISTLALLPPDPDNIIIGNAGGTQWEGIDGQFIRNILQHDVQSAIDDFGAGKLVTIEGAPGAAIATHGDYITTGDLNDAQAGDVALYANAVLNTPSIPGVAFWHVSTRRTYTAANALQQMAISYPSATRPESWILTRSKSPVDGTWSPYASVSSITVTNATGLAVRHADGRQETESISPTIASVVGGSASSGAVNFPLPFVANPTTVQATVNTSSPHRFTAAASRTPTQYTAFLGDLGPGSSVSAAVFVSAKGRWY